MALREALDQINLTGIKQGIKIKEVRSRYGVSPVEMLRFIINEFRYMIQFIPVAGGAELQYLRNRVSDNRKKATG